MTVRTTSPVATSTRQNARSSTGPRLVRSSEGRDRCAMPLTEVSPIRTTRADGAVPSPDTSRRGALSDWSVRGLSACSPYSSSSRSSWPSTSSRSRPWSRTSSPTSWRRPSCPSTSSPSTSWRRLLRGPTLRGLGPFARFSASRSAARSSVIDSTSSSLRRVALTSPSVTYGPNRPSLAPPPACRSRDRRRARATAHSRHPDARAPSAA